MTVINVHEERLSVLSFDRTAIAGVVDHNVHAHSWSNHSPQVQFKGVQGFYESGCQ